MLHIIKIPFLLRFNYQFCSRYSQHVRYSAISKALSLCSVETKRTQVRPTKISKWDINQKYIYRCISPQISLHLRDPARCKSWSCWKISTEISNVFSMLLFTQNSNHTLNRKRALSLSPLLRNMIWNGYFNNDESSVDIEQQLPVRPRVACLTACLPAAVL